MDNRMKNGRNTTTENKTDSGAERTKSSSSARNTSSGTRKVSLYQSRNRDREIAEEARRLRQGMNDAEKRRRLEKKRKEERLKRQRIQTLVGLGLCIVVAVVLIFMTPIFNIKEIRLSGNNTIPKEIITQKIGYVVGSNLFATSSSKLERQMNEIPQVNNVKIDKHLFPSYIEIFIEESTPAGTVLCGSHTLVIDSDLKIIDDGDLFNKDKLPSISGISVESYELNTPLNIQSQEKREVLSILLSSLEDMGHIDKVTYISIDDLTSIKFNYDNRLEVICGSQLELDGKIRMFSEAIKTDEIKDNSMGIFDISVPGTATYES